MLLAGAGRGYCVTPACPTTITTCPCAINAAGTYNVTADLSASSTCIKINFPGARLNLNNHNLTGSRSGFGIVLHAKPVGAVINGGADFATGSFGAINHFAVGIENDAPGALIADFAVDVNGVGVVNTAPGAILALFDASGNGGAGAVVTLAVPASVSLINFRAFNNGGDGVDLSGLGGGKNSVA
jgi:hypothetical protein